MKNWYSIKNKSGVLDISLHDEIGLWGISAKDFINELKSNQGVKSINLSVHSPGGSVLDGLAIYNALVAHPAKVYGHVDGIAASAASFILMACNHISMPEDAFLMIHNAHGAVIGDADDMREMADIIEKLQDSIVNIYEKRTGKNRNDIIDMMSVETWMNSIEALENGFIDTVSDSIGVAAKCGAFNKYFKEMPVKNDVNYDDIETVRDFEKTLRDSGLSKGLATALTSRAKIVFKGEPENNDAEITKLSNRLANLKI